MEITTITTITMKRMTRLMRALAVVVAAGAFALALTRLVAYAQRSEVYDLVIEGGRVIDPDTGLDAVRNVGIRSDRIAEITDEPLQGREVIDASGLVVAPGFIDLHAHGQTNEANEYQVHDGVTTALDLESGRQFLSSWLESRTGRALINFGASVRHAWVRTMVMGRLAREAGQTRQVLDDEGPTSLRLGAIWAQVQDPAYEPLAEADIPALVEGLAAGLAEGGLGIGVPLEYYPGATRGEIFRVYEFAAARQVPVFTHVRAIGAGDIGIAAVQEALADAASTGASVHIVHLNSTSLGNIELALDMVSAARRQGVDVTTEVYPYTAASTDLDSAFFDEGWQSRLGISYGDLQWEATGERLTEETFVEYRRQGGAVIIHMMDEAWVEKGVRSPITLIGSDGMAYAPGAHPRSAGTFARVLGRYVREQRSLSLGEALAKMTIGPARRLESAASAMQRKGRLQVGADADVTIFDPATIRDTATFDGGLSFSDGVHHVLVNGVPVVRDGRTVPGVYPGRPVIGRYRR